MAEHKCNTCFYKHFDKDKEFPCKACDNYNAYVNYMAYKPVDTLTVHTWDEEDAFSDHGGGSTLDAYPELKEDVVNKPKHYMLFPDKGIEVRHVLEALVKKFELNSMGHSYMFVSDYVQMMQYGMRFMEKNGLEDLKKMRWYLDRMIEAYERDNN